MTREKPTEESMRIQLVEVHGRAKMHASRLWQLPFSYIGIVGLSFSLINKNSQNHWLIPLFFLYSVFGVVVGLAMLGAFEGVKRALTHMILLEKNLYLTQTTMVKIAYQFIPYFIILILGIVACVSVCLKFK